jgi:hypothetical protein
VNAAPGSARDASAGEPPPPSERRSAALLEAAIVVALGLGAIWLIRTQTTQGPVLGLPPAFLPMVCAAAILAVALLGLAVRLWRPEPLPAAPALPAWPAAMLLGVVVAGGLVLQLVGPFAAGLVVVALGLILLGERRPLALVGTMAAAAVVLAAVLQVWR